MAVGYLAQDWDPKLVRTRNEGKNFEFAVYDFGGAGVGFWDKRAFLMLDEEGDFLDPNQFMSAFEQIVDGTYGVHSFSGLDSEEYIMLAKNGEVDEDACTEDPVEMEPDQLEKLKALYEDVSQYWDDEEAEDSDIF